MMGGRGFGDSLILIFFSHNNLVIQLLQLHFLYIMRLNGFFIDLRSSRVGEENTTTRLRMSQVQGAWYVNVLLSVNIYCLF